MIVVLTTFYLWQDDIQSRTVSLSGQLNVIFQATRPFERSIEPQ